MSLFGTEKDVIPFSKFMSLLLAPSLDLEGCECLFPDALFFTDDGKADFVAKTDKDGKLSAIKDPKKLEKLTDLRHKFQAIALERVKKNDGMTLLQKLYIEQKELDQEESKEVNKEIKKGQSETNLRQRF